MSAKADGCPAGRKSRRKPPITADVLTSVFAEMRQAIDDLDTDKMDNAIHTLDGYSFDDENHKLYIRLCEAVADMEGCSGNDHVPDRGARYRCDEEFPGECDTISGWDRCGA